MTSPRAVMPVARVSVAPGGSNDLNLNEPSPADVDWAIAAVDRIAATRNRAILVAARSGQPLFRKLLIDVCMTNLLICFCDLPCCISSYEIHLPPGIGARI